MSEDFRQPKLGMRRRVALVASPDDKRTALANYLTSAGFSVHQCEHLVSPGSFSAIVGVQRADGAFNSLVDEVRSWVKLTKVPRVVVVTSKPNALQKLLSTYHGRLYVLAAPVFGWFLVDALRA